MKERLYCLIMAGGEGKRFWPEGKKGLPKQFFPINDSLSMLEVTFERMRRFIPDKRIFIVTNSRQIELIKQKMPFLKKSIFILEPFARNTAAAIGLAALYLESKDRQAIMLVTPSDHIIKNNKKFLKSLDLAAKAAASDELLVAIGIKPTSPNTEYGYIKIKSRPRAEGESLKTYYKLEKFVEKPDKETAEKFLKSGDYLWNSGIFAWKTSTILNAIERFMPELSRGLLEIKRSLGLPKQSKVISKVYNRLEAIPIDSGVMEKARNSVSLKADFGWADLGHWEDASRYAENFRIRCRGRKHRSGDKR